MDLKDLLQYFNESDTIGENREAVDLMRHYSREAQKITMEINTRFHEPEEMVRVFSELTGKQVDESFRLFPPFYTDFGKNITLGKNASAYYHCAAKCPAQGVKDATNVTLEYAITHCYSSCPSCNPPSRMY